jgi:hypothetical protein
VNDSAESGLALDDRVWDAHLSAECWEIDDELDRVNVIRDENERSSLVLNEGDDVVETILNGEWLLTHVFLLLVQSLFLLGFRFWSVLVQKLEGLGSSVAVEGILELGDGRRNLEAQVEDLLLALQSDVLWPFHHARQVAFGLNILADAEVTGSLFKKRVLRTSASSYEWSKLRFQVDHVPLPASCLSLPSLAGRARRQVSFPWEAVIEKRRSSANLVHQVL